MSDKCKPIGFFDSGVGGISVLKTAFREMPNENYIYFGDSKNAPYGEKSEEEIQELSLAAGSFLFSKGVKAIVIACNTATSAAVKLMREKYHIPVISMEPAVKPALQSADKGKVLVLATPATVSQQRYHKLLERLDAGDRVVNVGCSGLVELIEDGRTDMQSIHDYLQYKLSFLNGERIDAAVVGCTHYSFVKPQIQQYLEKRSNQVCQVFDGRYGTVRHLAHVLDEHGIRCTKDTRGSVSFYTSGHTTLISKYEELFNQFQ